MLNKDQGGGPKVVLATLASLEAGLARQLFIEWARDSRNLIVFPLQAQVQSSQIDSPGQQQHGGREGGGYMTCTLVSAVCITATLIANAAKLTARACGCECCNY